MADLRGLFVGHRREIRQTPPRPSPTGGGSGSAGISVTVVAMQPDILWSAMNGRLARAVCLAPAGKPANPTPALPHWGRERIGGHFGNGCCDAARYFVVSHEWPTCAGCLFGTGGKAGKPHPGPPPPGEGADRRAFRQRLLRCSPIFLRSAMNGRLARAICWASAGKWATPSSPPPGEGADRRAFR